MQVQLSSMFLCLWPLCHWLIIILVFREFCCWQSRLWSVCELYKVTAIFFLLRAWSSQKRNPEDKIKYQNVNYRGDTWPYESCVQGPCKVCCTTSSFQWAHFSKTLICSCGSRAMIGPMIGGCPMVGNEDLMLSKVRCRAWFHEG